jgi:hypothetical protein
MSCHAGLCCHSHKTISMYILLPGSCIPWQPLQPHGVQSTLATHTPHLPSALHAISGLEGSAETYGRASVSCTCAQQAYINYVLQHHPTCRACTSDSPGTTSTTCGHRGASEPSGTAAVTGASKSGSGAAPHSIRGQRGCSNACDCSRQDRPWLKLVQQAVIVRWLAVVGALLQLQASIC